MTKKINIKKITVIAMLCAIAYLCMFLFKFKVSFLTFDFKDAVLAVTSFLYGPIYGLVSAVIVAFVELISVSETGWYGFVMNALSSGIFALVCGLIYKYNRTLLGAVLGVASAVAAMTATMLIANIFITPIYTGMERAAVISMLPKLLLPFNLCKGVVNAAITMIIYKPITLALKKSRLVVGGVSDHQNNRNTIAVIISAAVIFTVAVAVIVFVLQGNFEFLA